MADWITLAGAAIISVLGFAWLALAMQVHWEQVYGYSRRSMTMQAALRLFGVAALIISAVLCFIADRPSMAALLWIMMLAFGATSIAMALAWKPALLQWVWPQADASGRSSKNY